MTVINQLIKRLFAIHSLNEKIKSAEKAKIPSLKEEASILFKSCYETFIDTQTKVNNLKSGCKEHAELHIVLAEAAFYTEHYEVSRKVIEQYLQLSPQLDQYYCRAKLTLGLIINQESEQFNGNESIKYHQLAVSEVMKALDVAVLPNNLQIYTFLVFNVSVTFWRIVSPFLRAGRAKFFAPEISRVVSALEQQNDPDKDWRVMFLSAAALCLDDDKQSKGAVDYMDKAIEHAEALLNETLGEEDKIAAQHKASKKELEEIMGAFRSIEEREALLVKPPRIDPDLPEDHVYDAPNPPPLSGLAAEGYDRVKELLDESQKKQAVADGNLRVVTDRKTAQQEKLAVLYMQRIFVNQSDSKRFSALPQVVKYARASTLVQLQCLVSGCVPEKEVEATFSGLVKKLSDLPSSTARNETLLDVCRCAWTLKQRPIAMKCFSVVQAETAVSPVIRVKLDTCDAIRSLADLNEEKANELAGGRLSMKQTDGFRVNRRIEAIKLLERTVGVCQNSLADRFLSQEICLLMWNACIPLLQPHLRAKIYTSLKCIASTLEGVASPLAALRTQVHLEIAKCEEQSDFVVNAKTEGTKALHSDYGALGDLNAPTALTSEDPIVVELDRSRELDQIILPFVALLELRSSVFDSPGDTEGKALMWLQQARESKSKQFISDMVCRALYVMLQEVRDMDSGAGDNDSATADLSLALLTKGPLEIPPVALDEINAVLKLQRAGAGTVFQPFTKLQQRRCLVMQSIAELAHSLSSVDMLQQAAVYLLSFVWDSADPLLFSLLDAQVQAHYLLADSLLWRINNIPYTKPPVDEFSAVKSSMIDSNANADTDINATGRPTAPQVVDTKSLDPRSLGLKVDSASEEMMTIKRLVLAAMERGVQVSLSLKDTVGIQNGLIYFWNLHIHIFRGSGALYPHCMEEVLDFLKASSATLEAVKAFPPASDPAMIFDDRIRISVLEVLAGFLESRSQLPQALEVANKGSGGASLVEYSRRKVVEMSSRLTLLASAVPGDKKAAKGGSAEPPKFDSPILNVYSLLAQAELPVDVMPSELSLSLVEKAIALLDGEVKTFLASQDWPALTQERFSQLLEMQAECWTRLTRLRILFGDVIGSQYTAEKCLALVAKENLTSSDSQILSNRVWRWVSVCERLFGIAITNIIQPEGQDLTLQNELRLVALSHMVTATNHAIRAKNEQLVVTAATNAWNTIIPLVDCTDLRPRLFPLQRALMNNLLLCKGVTVQSAVMELRQQLYLSIIEGFANVFDWDGALKTVLEAFEHVSVDLQKPLWQWRVISMSKKGKNVLDGLQKLKENDPTLQAQVYIILARSSNNPKQQLESYLKAVEILQQDMGRVEYMLEVAQWMATAGIPRSDISEMLLSALDALYEVEERCMPEIADMDEDEAKQQIDGTAEEGYAALNNDGKSMQSSRYGSRRGGTKTNKAPSVRSAAKSVTKSASGTSKQGSATQRSKTAGSVANSKKNSSNRGEPVVDLLPPMLNFKQLEQTARGLVMLAALDSKADTSSDKSVEAVYFLRKALHLWFDILSEVHRKNTYSALSDEQKAATAFDAFELATVPVFLKLPEEPVLLLPWLHTHQQALIVLTQQAAAVDSLFVPSAQSLPTIALTVHYILKLSTSLSESGHCKYALLCLGFVRMVLLTATPVVAGYEAVMVATHLRSVRVLHSMGLGDEASALSHIVVGSAASNSQVTVASFLTQFVRQVGPSSVGAASKPEKLVETVSPFGILTWTAQMDGSVVDVPLVLLDVCDSLLQLGQVALCESVALVVEKEFRARDNVRALVQCSTLLSRILFVKGRYADVVSRVLSMRAEMTKAGDAVQFGAQTELLVRAYLKLGNADEARQVTSFSIQLLEDVCVLSVDKQGLRQQHDASHQTIKTAQGMQSNHTLTSGVGKTSVAATVVSQSSKGKSVAESEQQQQSEMSSENVGALASLVMCYSEVLLAVAKQSMAENEDPRPLYMEICDRLGRCHELICDVSGSSSDLAARILRKRAAIAMDLLLHFHETVSGLVPLDMYAGWLQDNVLMCAEYLEGVVDIRRKLLACVPETEGHYTVDSAVSADGTKDLTTVLPYKLISLPVVRALALAELSLAQVQVLFASLKSHHLSKAEFGEPPVLSVEQQYLEDTKPNAEYSLDSFVVPPLSKAAQLSSAAAQQLVGCDFAQDGELVFAAALAMRLNGEGAFDCVWNPDAAHPDSMDAAAALKHALSPQASDARSQLTAAAKAAISSGRGGLDLVKTSCAALIETYGSNAAGSAASWMLQLQSVCAKQWLSDVWLSTLSATSEVSAAQSRLEALERDMWPTAAAVKQIAAEKAFLASASVAYRRLSVTADPAVIVNTCLPANCAILCLQFCPLKETLYVCAGSKTPTVAAAPAAKPVKGAAEVVAEPPKGLDDKLWVVDKVKLSESQRRALQTIKQQHRAWQADVTKFVAIYGESTGPDFDLEGATNAHEAKTLRKAEHALDERLRALVSDLEALLSPLIGSASTAFIHLTATATRLSSEAAPGTKASMTPASAAPSLMLLLDSSLQILPWEALQFAGVFQGRTSRDFSLHMLHHRVQALATPSADSSNVPAINVASSSVRYIADPLSEDAGNKSEGLLRESIARNLSALSERGELVGGAKWQKVRSGNGIVSQQDWNVAVEQSSMRDNKTNTPVALFVYALGRFGSLLSPTDMLAMNLERLALFVSFDLGHNDTSYRRQNSVDVLKRARDIECEQPLIVAAVMALSGTATQLIHLWSTPFAAQNRLLAVFWKSFSNPRKERVVVSLAEANNYAGVAGTEGAPKSLKRWVRHSRVIFGLPHVTYSDA